MINTSMREYGGTLGDGEREGKISAEEFLALYPEGVFRPVLETVGLVGEINQASTRKINTTLVSGSYGVEEVEIETGLPRR